mmetsp:Transcript_17852/g.30297  ORF Transcript_17852/g.30297 Transcript_17852/m.30297 type:complete len:83 (+) Transcript_17852:1125-1373(+)
MKRWPRLVSALAWIQIVVDLGLFVHRNHFHDHFWDALDYLKDLGESPPHSLYTMHRFETPYYSWLHQRGQAFPLEFPEVRRT